VIEPQSIIEWLKWIGRNSEVGFINPDRWSPVCGRPTKQRLPPKRVDATVPPTRQPLRRCEHLAASTVSQWASPMFHHLFTRGGL